MDVRKINNTVKREKFVLPTTEEIISKLSGAKIFSSLDAASEFYQIPLEEKSTRLTTFITPFDRYVFKRQPFGFTSSPEIFQRRHYEGLRGWQFIWMLFWFSGKQKKNMSDLKKYSKSWNQLAYH